MNREEKLTATVLSEHGRLIEALLFLENEVLSHNRLRQLTGLSEEELEIALQELETHYMESHHGIELVKEQRGVRFLPCQDLHEHLRNAYGRKVDKRLSKAALETLSIIAYAQPITRREIENIRGVDSDAIMRVLRERDYISMVGRKDGPGRPGLYGTTQKFLFEFNLPSIASLPQFSELERLRFEQSEESADEN